MSQFVGHPQLEQTEHRDHAGRPVYRLVQDLYYIHGAGNCISIPAGRLTNLATFPAGVTPLGRLFWWAVEKCLFRDLSNPNGRCIAATILHDDICSEDYPGHTRVTSEFTRYEADCLFRGALESLGAPRWQTLLAYWAVRISAIAQGKE